MDSKCCDSDYVIDSDMNKVRLLIKHIKKNFQNEQHNDIVYSNGYVYINWCHQVVAILHVENRNKMRVVIYVYLLCMCTRKTIKCPHKPTQFHWDNNVGKSIDVYQIKVQQVYS